MKNITHKILVLFTAFMIACGNPTQEFPLLNHWRQTYPADSGSMAMFRVDSTGSVILLRLWIDSSGSPALIDAIRHSTATARGVLEFDGCQFHLTNGGRQNIQYRIDDSRDHQLVYQDGVYFLKVQFNPRFDNGSIWYVYDTAGESYACMTQRTLHFNYAVTVSYPGNTQPITDIGESSIWFSGEQRM